MENRMKKKLFAGFVNRFRMAERNEYLETKNEPIKAKFKKLVMLFYMSKSMSVKSGKTDSNQMMGNNWNILKA